MNIDTNTIVSVTEANQNFSRVTRIAEKSGQAIIFKNNRPIYAGRFGQFSLDRHDRRRENRFRGGEDSEEI